MKVNREKLSNEIEEIIAYGVAHCEEIDLTAKKITDRIDELICAVDIINVSSKWISVEDKLPEKHVNVLIKHYTDGISSPSVLFGSWEGDRWRIYGGRTADDVTHWIDKPEP